MKGTRFKLKRSIYFQHSKEVLLKLLLINSQMNRKKFRFEFFFHRRRFHCSNVCYSSAGFWTQDRVGVNLILVNMVNRFRMSLDFVA